MPQLDPTFFPSQLFWLAVSFALLFLLLKYWALPQVTTVIEKREKKIEGDIEKAKSLQKEIDLINKRCEQELHQARRQAHELLQKKISDIKAYNTEKEHELAEKLNTHIKNTESKVRKAQKEALHEIENLTVDLSTILLEKLVQVPFNPETTRQTVSQLLKDNSHV